MPAGDAELRPESTRTLAGLVLRGAPLPARTRHLRFLTGPEAGETVALGGAMTIGRGADADVRLADPAVSRRHARVEPARDGGRLVDLSKNGVRVNGRRLRRPRQLRHGDRLRLGTTELLVVWPAPVARAARPVPAARRLGLAAAAAGLLAAAALWLAL